MGIPDRAALFSVRCTVDWIVAAGVVCRKLLPALVFRTSFRLLPELVPDNGKHSISHGPLLNMVYSRGIGICPMPFCLHYFIATLFNECRNQPSSVRLPIPSGMKRRSMYWWNQAFPFCRVTLTPCEHSFFDYDFQFICQPCGNFTEMSFCKSYWQPKVLFLYLTFIMFMLLVLICIRQRFIGYFLPFVISLQIYTNFIHYKGFL